MANWKVRKVTEGDVAMGLPITTDGQLVLVQQYKHGQRENLLELPAGFVQEGKSVIESAIAELEEETGIKTTEDQLVSLGKVAHSPTKSTQVAYGFLATGLTFNSTQNFDELEDITVITVAPHKAIEMILAGQIWVSDTVCFIMKAYHLYPDLFKE